MQLPIQTKICASPVAFRTPKLQSRILNNSQPALKKKTKSIISNLNILLIRAITS